MVFLIEQGMLVYGMAVVCVIGLISKLMTNHVYKNLVKQSDNISAAEDGWLRQLKTKYQIIYRTNGQNRNVSAFVEKNIYRYQKYGTLLYKWDNLELQSGIFALLLGMIGTLSGFLADMEAKTIIFQFSMGVIFAITMIFLDNWIDTTSKRELLKVNLCDYFTNALVIQTPEDLEKEREKGRPANKVKNYSDYAKYRETDQEKSYDNEMPRKGEAGKDRAAYRDERKSDTDTLKKSLEEIAAARENGENGKKRKLTLKEEQLIEDIISEYLT